MNSEIGKGEIMKRNQMSRILMLATAAGVALFSSPVFACSLANWEASEGSPDESDLGLPRYVGECGFIPSTVGQFVQDNIEPAADPYLASFYALSIFGTGSTASNQATIFQANTEDNGQPGSPITVTIQGGSNTLNGPVAILSTPGGTSSEIRINTGGNYTFWNHYKVEWTANGTATLTINGGDSVNVNAGPGVVVESQLGHITSTNPNFRSNGLAFDQFVSLRSPDPETNPLCPGDADGSGRLTGTDVVGILNDATVSLRGQPDFNGDSRLTGTDVIGVLISSCP